jgi:hypothetical protein
MREQEIRHPDETAPTGATPFCLSRESVAG